MAVDIGQREVRTMGTRVRVAREQAGWTQRELARRMQMTHTTLARIESGSSNPRLKTLIRLARVLGVPLGELVRPAAPRRHAMREGGSLWTRVCRWRRQVSTHWIVAWRARTAA